MNLCMVKEDEVIVGAVCGFFFCRGWRIYGEAYGCVQIEIRSFRSFVGKSNGFAMIKYTITLSSRFVR